MRITDFHNDDNRLRGVQCLRCLRAKQLKTAGANTTAYVTGADYQEVLERRRTGALQNGAPSAHPNEFSANAGVRGCLAARAFARR
jgi:hypothetical protein